MRRLRPFSSLGAAMGLIGVLTLAACAPQPGEPARAQGMLPDPLVVGLIPNIAPEEQRAHYEPFAAYLEAVLGVDIRLFVASSYAGVVTAMASGHLHVAYLGGLTYVQAEQQVELVPLVTEIDRETGTSEYTSAIVVRSDSGLSSAEEVVAAGGVFAMGDVSSTSGSLYPRIMLVEAGADCRAADLTQCPPVEVLFTGGHDAAAQAVLSGTAIAAGVERRILDRLIREGAVPDGALDIVAEQRVEGYPWVATAALGAEARRAVTEAFLAIDDPALLDLLRAQAYTTVTAHDYAEIRTRSEELGLLKVSEE